MNNAQTTGDVAAPPQRYARIAGVLFLLSVVAGLFGEFIIPSSLLAPGDATTTAENIRAGSDLFRLGFAFYLIEAVCDVALTMVLYVLLKPVHKNLALLAVLFRLLSTTTFAFSQLLYFSTTVVLGDSEYLSAFAPEQRDALTLLLIEFSGLGSGSFMLFYGLASATIGYLIFKSGYVPRLLGGLLALGGLCFAIRSFLVVLAPSSASSLLLFPTILAAVTLGTWLVIRGVNAAGWHDQVAKAVTGASRR